MTLYKIRDWDRLFENNRTRELKTLQWVPVPNKQDGDGYTAIMAMKNGPAIFGAWIACVQIASRCDPRGTLLRDGGKPHDCDSLARMSRMPKAIMQEMFETLSSGDINWLISEHCENPAPGVAFECGIPASGCLEGKGKKEGKEGNGKCHPDALSALRCLNERSGKTFRGTDTDLCFISERLRESEVTIEGVKKMITRQCVLWGSDPKMQAFLRPETLFNKTKFDSYYASKDMPLPNGDLPNADPNFVPFQ